MEDCNTYEIFKTGLDNTTELVETVERIDEAQNTSKRLKEEKSGEFFIFEPIDGKVIDPHLPSIAQDRFAS